MIQSPSSHSLSLAELVERLCPSNMPRDQAACRALAVELQEVASRVEVCVVSDLGLSDVVVTFAMRRALKLIITGWADEGRAEVTVRYKEADFPGVSLRLWAEPRADPATWCTLDHSVEGDTGWLLDDVGSHAKGAAVTLLARSTIGHVDQYRVQRHGQQFSVPTALLGSQQPSE